MVDPLRDLNNYSKNLTISKVIKFFQRKGIEFTKTMIQNYVRVGAIDPPDGRVYLERHMKALVMIELLKPVYSLDEIKNILKILDAKDDYDSFLEAYSRSYEFWDNRSEVENRHDFLLEITTLCSAEKRITHEKAPTELYQTNV